MKDALNELPETTAKIRSHLLSLPPAKNEESEEKSDFLQEEGVNFIIPSNLIDFCTRIEVLLRLKLSGHTNTLTEASNLMDELYERGEIENEQQYRNALDKFFTK